MTAQYSIIELHKAAQYTQYSTVLHSIAQCSTARYCNSALLTLQYSTIKYSTVLYSTTQHSPRYHSLAEHSTVQYYKYCNCTVLAVQYSSLEYSTEQYGTELLSVMVNHLYIQQHTIYWHISNFGITGTAFSLISSYLLNRTQSVTIQSHTSPSSPLLTGVPQGSVLGPLLFCLYTTPLSYIFTNSSVSFHLYADDTQLYISFSSSDSVSNLNTLSSTLDSVYTWLSSNRLPVNPSKTEHLLLGTPQQRSKLVSSSIFFRENILIPSDKCRNLGVIFDSDLTFKNDTKISTFIRRYKNIFTFVNFAKFVLLLTLILLSFLLTLLYLQNLTIATLFSTIFQPNP